MVLLAEGNPVIIETTLEQQFKITSEALAEAITPKTRMLVINSPSNPTGVAYSRKELEAIAEVLAANPNILIVTDDMYEHIIWNDEGFVNILNANGDLYERCMVLNGVSKAYSMTGWRIGYAAGPVEIVKAMKKIQSQSTSNPCSISQAASVAALNGDQGCIQTMLAAFKERHDYVLKTLNSIPHISCMPSDGTFYSFAHIQSFIDSRSDLNNDVDVANMLLENAGVAVVPGSAFGSEGYMRLSFATSMSNLEKALERIGQAFYG
jgi:aspartate aminotransferase